MSAHETDNQPRYTTKRLHDEIDHARRLGRLEALQEAAAIVDDSVGEFEKAAGGPDGVAHDAMLLAGDALELVRDAIREKISAVPASAPREEILPKYCNLVNGDLCELVSHGADGVTFRRVGSTQLAYLGHAEFTKRFEVAPPAPLPNVVGIDAAHVILSKYPKSVVEAAIAAYLGETAPAERKMLWQQDADNAEAGAKAVREILSPAPAELSVGSEPVAWTTKGNLETLASCPDEARYVWGKKYGEQISVPLYSAIQAPAELSVAVPEVAGEEEHAKPPCHQAEPLSDEPPLTMSTATGVSLASPAAPVEHVLGAIAAERDRQIAAGYDAAHDDTHVAGDIINSSWGASARIYAAQDRGMSGDVEGYTKDLIQAAAQIVAEIERVQRAALSASEVEG